MDSITEVLDEFGLGDLSSPKICGRESNPWSCSGARKITKDGLGEGGGGGGVWSGDVDKGGSVCAIPPPPRPPPPPIFSPCPPRLPSGIHPPLSPAPPHSPTSPPRSPISPLQPPTPLSAVCPPPPPRRSSFVASPTPPSTVPRPPPTPLSVIHPPRLSCASSPAPSSAVPPLPSPKPHLPVLNLAHHSPPSITPPPCPPPSHPLSSPCESNKGICELEESLDSTCQSSEADNDCPGLDSLVESLLEPSSLSWSSTSLAIDEPDPHKTETPVTDPHRDDVSKSFSMPGLGRDRARSWGRSDSETSLESPTTQGRDRASTWGSCDSEKTLKSRSSSKDLCALPEDSVLDSNERLSSDFGSPTPNEILEGPYRACRVSVYSLRSAFTYLDQQGNGTLYTL